MVLSGLGYVGTVTVLRLLNDDEDEEDSKELNSKIRIRYGVTLAISIGSYTVILGSYISAEKNPFSSSFQLS